MNKYLLYWILFLFTLQIIHSQENGVVAFDLPIRNSLKFNRYVINPTFSFVREQNKYISFSNKRQWVQFADAPQAYLFGYSGRFKENIGMGVGLFQQDYGVQTTFGAVLNFAYNVSLNRDDNLTFGLNLGAYQSGINDGRVIVNEPDPVIQSIPKNFMLTINPGINYGTGFFDFGLSINNLVSYNLNASKLIEENPAQSVQAHIMYTGYMNSSGFFDESKFSSLIRSEFKKDKTVLSGLAMLSIPKGLWGQVGYNTLYGASAGIGLNISEQIAVEYNYEQSVGDLVSFGSSHEITLAYRFKNNKRFMYNGDDEEKSVFTPSRKSKRVIASKNPTKKTGSATPGRLKSRRAALEDKNKITEDLPTNVPQDNQEEQANLEEETKLIAEIEAKKEVERLKAEEQARIKAEKELEEKQSAEALKRKQEAEAKARTAKELQEKRDAEVRAREEVLKKKREEAKAKEKARLEEEKRKQEEEARLKAEAEEKALLEAERLKVEEELKAKEALEQAKREEAEVLSKLKEQAIEGTDSSGPELDEETLNSINNLNQISETSKNLQQLLIDRLSDKVDIKQQDLDDLKEENDLSEQGITVAPKPFKSITEENAEIESIKKEIDKVIEEQDIKIQELEAVLIMRKGKKRDKLDPLSASYLRTIEKLKTDRLKTIRTKESLIANLKTINEATEVERKRRIKRAAYDNQQDRYAKDRATLESIKKFTDPSPTPLNEEDFDFGEEQSNSIRIVKDVSNEENGYYMVIAVHDTEAKRDEFLRNVVASGETNINFFFDVNSNKYFIYSKKFNYIEAANTALDSKENKPYNSKMSIVKIEN
ncbi:PorP/SprF family type IX secretion system membrane protein [Seonamhaeicola maritimus]|uniref:PorP/SprF family type IX secretion system membrane protein n=1 Tax=Seonamhaeicola maritimus TaxID=2591822 RepID=UPI0024943079|nr:PorP/SprF family type IX secretion system membrane protein [Seonamhaeicola maritimus]